MRPSRVGRKRPRDMGASFDFIPGLTLSEHPFEQRKDLFMKKLLGMHKCKSLHPTEFEGYTIRERFKWMGWEQLLSFDCDKIYKRVVIQWMASLSKVGDRLSGMVDGKSYTITPRIIRDLLGVDTRTDLPYMRFKEVDSQAGTAENKIRWAEVCKTVFGIEENALKAQQSSWKLRMTPLAKVLWQIAEATFLPRPSSFSMQIYLHEIHLLHALFTGDYLYSFAHLMIDDIWDMYEHQDRQYIHYGNYTSEILYRLGAVSEDEYVEVVSPEYSVISVGSFRMLKFSQSPTEYIIDDRETQQRITFPKEGTRETPPINQFSQTYQYMPPQMPVPNPNMEMTNLFTKFQNQYDEMKTVFTNIQKQMEHQVLEAERREQAREKLADEREKLAEKREKRAEERERQAEEREKRAETRAIEGEKRAEEREKWAKERERKVDEPYEKKLLSLLR